VDKLQGTLKLTIKATLNLTEIVKKLMPVIPAKEPRPKAGWQIDQWVGRPAVHEAIYNHSVTV